MVVLVILVVMIQAVLNWVIRLSYSKSAFLNRRVVTRYESWQIFNGWWKVLRNNEISAPIEKSLTKPLRQVKFFLIGDLLNGFLNLQQII